MTRTPAVLLSLLTALFLVAFSDGVQGAAVSADQKDVKAAEPQEHNSRVFMSGLDASSFFKRRSRRSIKSQYELNVEQRQRLAADEQRREYREEQRNEYENYVEEVRDEQEERTREKTEQWREFHYDGLYRWYQYTRHHV
ncbi:unique cartilage matrix-associated protein-like [Brienomyrus brachyistius]|uniref:unique cartilage matrix-associated protein-like n=1 Tax=Brienomyrus brachyistius TaxID=42636 RepID=UPI0020B3C55B|nr:unique cartilage matrix-associated protein-like [Brienomyrus brachyistius]